MRRWVAESGIRWGADAAHRAELGQPTAPTTPGASASTACCSATRCPATDEALFGGVLPYDDVEGADAELLGRLAEFCDTLFRFRVGSCARRAPVGWRDALGALLAALLARDGPPTPYQHHAHR